MQENAGLFQPGFLKALRRWNVKAEEIIERENGIAVFTVVKRRTLKMLKEHMVLVYPKEVNLIVIKRTKMLKTWRL